MKCRTGGATALPALVLAACSGAPPHVATHFPSDRTYSLSAVAAAPIFSITSTRELCSTRWTSGCSLVSRTRNVFAAPHEGIVLLDSHNGLMRFDSSGAYVGGIGALGSQTGEYVNVSSLAFVDDSTVWVVDPGLQRATLYVDGAPHRIIRLQPGSRAIVRYLATRSGVLGLSIPVADSAGSAVVASWGRVSDTGAVVPLQVVPAWALKGADDNFIPELPFFTARPLWAADASGVAYEVPSGSAPAVIVAYTSTGAPRWRVRLSMPTRRPTPIEIAREDTARIRRVFRTRADQLLAQCKDSLQIQHCVAVRVERRYASRAGKRYQVPSAMTATDVGGLWLRGAPLAASDSVDWLLLGSGGELRGRLRLAASDSVRGGDGGAVLVARTDSAAGVRAAWLRLRNHPPTGIGGAEPTR